MRIATKGPKTGVCNICGTFGPLTDDHIPPKGVVRPRQVEILNLTDLLSIPRPKGKSRISQNGVKFRTLCSDCNNRRLGTLFDPELIKLTKDVTKILGTDLYLPSRMIQHYRTTRIVKSVVGHLLAHGVGEHRTGSAINDLTDYFLSDDMSFPGYIKIYYWIYPYQEQIILKGFSPSLHLWNSFTTCLLLKFFPLSFFFVIDEPKEWDLDLERLDLTLPSSIDEYSTMRINLSRIPPQRWPECPDDSGVVMHTPGATAAINIHPQ